MRPGHMRSRSHKVSVFKNVSETPPRFAGSLCPTNLEEQKQRFLKHGIVPKFVLKGGNAEVAMRAAQKERGQIRFGLFKEAKRILETVKEKYGDGADFLEATFGKRVDYRVASEIIAEYLQDHSLEGEMTIYWTPDLTCSARMMWHGPNLKYNRPEARKYTLIIKNSGDNNFLREAGIRCLADHEIGTHYFRMVNEGFQPWFSNRNKFGLRTAHARESVASEEGFAAVNTVLNSKTKYMWTSAILYYTSCKAADMSFRELFEHLERYVKDPEQRWRHVMRVKRGLRDPNDVGGYGNDQCYFEGAVTILRNLENIDFQLLYAGKICIDEINRIRRIARMDCIKTPHFLADLEKYKRTLRQIAVINELIDKPEKKPPIAKVLRKRPSGRRKFGSGEIFLHTPTPPPAKTKQQSAGGRWSVTSQESDATGDGRLFTQTNAKHRDVPLANQAARDKDRSRSEGGFKDGADRLLVRPQSTPNKVATNDNKKKSDGVEKLGWFGLLDRNANMPQMSEQ